MDHVLTRQAQAALLAVLFVSACRTREGTESDAAVDGSISETFGQPGPAWSGNPAMCEVALGDWSAPPVPVECEILPFQEVSSDFKAATERYCPGRRGIKPSLAWDGETWGLLWLRSLAYVDCDPCPDAEIVFERLDRNLRPVSEQMLFRMPSSDAGLYNGNIHWDGHAYRATWTVLEQSTLATWNRKGDMLAGPRRAMVTTSVQRIWRGQHSLLVWAEGTPDRKQESLRFLVLNDLDRPLGPVKETEASEARGGLMAPTGGASTSYGYRIAWAKQLEDRRRGAFSVAVDPLGTFLEAPERIESDCSIPADKPSLGIRPLSESSLLILGPINRCSWGNIDPTSGEISAKRLFPDIIRSVFAGGGDRIAITGEVDTVSGTCPKGSVGTFSLISLPTGDLVARNILPGSVSNAPVVAWSGSEYLVAAKASRWTRFDEGLRDWIGFCSEIELLRFDSEGRPL